MLYSFYQGFCDSINLDSCLYFLTKDRNIKDNYCKLLFYNLIILLFYKIFIIFGYVFKQYAKTIYFINMIFWVLPNYLITIPYNSIYTSEIVKIYTNIRLQDKNTYKCYDKLSNYLVHNFYYQMVILLLMVESYLIIFVPIIGKFLDWLLNSLVYSYFAWEYTWGFQKIAHISRYELFENNWIYFLGYGSIIGLIKINLDYFTSYICISVIFPILSLNGIIKYNDKEIISKSYTPRLPIFTLPIYYSKAIIDQLVKIIKKKFSR